jgi:hypothetical protein
MSSIQAPVSQCAHAPLRQLLVEVEVTIHHAIDREVLRDKIAAGARCGQGSLQSRRELIDITANPAVDAVAHDFGNRSARHG